MKLTWRLWVLAIVLISSLIWILNISTSATLMLLGLSIAILFVLTTVKSNIGKFLIIILLLTSMTFLIYQQSDANLKIKSVELNSTAYVQGLRAGQEIISINGQELEDLDSYNMVIASEFPGRSNQDTFAKHL